MEILLTFLDYTKRKMHFGKKNHMTGQRHQKKGLVKRQHLYVYIYIFEL